MEPAGFPRQTVFAEKLPRTILGKGGMTFALRFAIVMVSWLSEARPFLPKVLIETLRSPFGLKGTAVLLFVWQVCYSNGVKSGAGLHVLVSVGQRLRFCMGA